MDRLSGDWNRGYTRAIQDIIEIFNYIQDDLKHHKKGFSQKTAKRLLEVILQERANLRDHIGNGFIRYNGQLQEFEYYMPKGNTHE